MDALTPGGPPAAPIPSHATGAPYRAPEQPDPPRPAPAAAPSAEPLPALPASVQRSQLDGPPPPKMMTREQMTALLDLMH